MVMTSFERKALDAGYSVIAGIDEAGRGPLAGPVVAAACLFSLDTYIEGVNDSKKLSPKKRERLYGEILSLPIGYGIGIIDVATIDEINIYQATLRAMEEAVKALSTAPDYLLVDGMPLNSLGIPSEKIIKGDTKSHTIASASILAKVTRDMMMQEYDIRWPEYGFAKHKGYGTRQHIEALKKHGPCPIHRLTFEPIKSMNTP